MELDHKIFYSPNTFQSYGDLEIAAVEKFLRENPLNDQEMIHQFEHKIASLFNMKHGVYVNSGSSANLLGCLALGFTEKDEVITPACTFPTTLSPLIAMKCKVVFCDIAPGRYVPSVQQVLDLVTPTTTAVLIPDLVGDTFDFIELKKQLEARGRADIKFFEDACDTVTTSIADIATISFYASHVLSSGGLGGMVLTNDDTLYQRCETLKTSGPWDFSAPPYCAAFGIQNAEKFEHIKEARHRNLLHYCERLKNCSFYTLPLNVDAIWLSMALVSKNHRFEIVNELESHGIQTRLCMAGNILRQPFYHAIFPDQDPASFANTEIVFERGFLIGLHQGLSIDDIDYVCDKLLELAKKYECE